jgi:hypothetical protein
MTGSRACAKSSYPTVPRWTLANSNNVSSKIGSPGRPLLTKSAYSAVELRVARRQIAMLSLP